MKTFLPLILLVSCLTFASSAQTTSPDCKKFKTGTFYYPTLPGKKVSIRKESTQESYNDGKLEMLWKVEWLSDCKYILTCTKVLIENNPIKVGDRIIATIVKTEEDCFTTELMFYNKENPDGMAIPAGTMCIQKN